MKKDPLVAAKHFSSREQGEKESVRDYATQLRKAFAEAYPKEDTVSAVLLQKFMTGLCASITRQMLLKGRPSTMEQAIEEAVVIEEALKFGREVSEVNVNAIQKKEDSGELGQLKTLLERMVKKIDTEAQMSEVMLGRVDVEENSDRTVSQYIKDVQRTLKGAYDTIRINLEVAQKKRKDAYDGQCAGIDFKIGDRVWLFNPAIKTGHTKKLSSLWRGPYTIIDRLSSVNYKIQLIGTTKTQIVHRNWLKICYGDPERSSIQREPEQSLGEGSVWSQMKFLSSY